MPSFRDRIPDQQIWEIAAYVLSMSGHAPKDAASSRSDDLRSGPAKTQARGKPQKAMPGPDADEPGK
jgi:cytochrome c oxidase cbb3-type subunit 3